MRILGHLPNYLRRPFHIQYIFITVLAHALTPNLYLVSTVVSTVLFSLISSLFPPHTYAASNFLTFCIHATSLYPFVRHSLCRVPLATFTLMTLRYLNLMNHNQGLIISGDYFFLLYEQLQLICFEHPASAKNHRGQKWRFVN